MSIWRDVVRPVKIEKNTPISTCKYDGDASDCDLVKILKDLQVLKKEIDNQIIEIKSVLDIE